MQSLIAVGTGGIRGLGIDGGRAEAVLSAGAAHGFYLCEYLRGAGAAGRAACVAAFCILGYRGLRAAFLSTDPFARFLAFGLTSTILMQAFFNMSVVLALVPTKGIPLPFISSGGTCVFVTLASMGVLLNITREID